MEFEERRPVRSAFSSTAGGFLAAVSVSRMETAAVQHDQIRNPRLSAQASDAAHLRPERRN